MKKIMLLGIVFQFLATRDTASVSKVSNVSLYLILKLELIEIPVCRFVMVAFANTGCVSSSIADV